MTFNIEDFKARGLALGGARPSLFEIQLEDWPGAAPGTPPKLSFLARAASIPPSIIEPIDVPYFGRKVKIVGDRVYPNWSITVMNDEDFALRIGFQNWHYSLNSEVENLMSSVNNMQTYPSGYKTNIKVKQYARDGRELAFYTLVGAFPVTVEEIPLDWERTNEVEMFTVEFAYDYWVPQEITGSGTVLQEFGDKFI